MLSFTNNVGNLFNILGKLGALCKNVRSHQNSQTTAMTDVVTGVVAQLNSESDIQAQMGSAYLNILGSVESACSISQQIASNIINRKVFRDNPRINQTLQQGNTLSSIQEVVRQMKLQGANVLAVAVSATAVVVNTPGPHFTGTGNGALVASTKRPFDGRVLENMFGETVMFTCTSDSYVGGAVVGNESFTVTGNGAQSDVFAFNWPLGSNAQINTNAIDGDANNSSGNLLTNSGFNSFTNVANLPDNWTLLTGTAGVNTFQEVTLVYSYSGPSALRITGDSSNTLTSIQQQFNSSSGTTSTLSPQTQYAFNLWMRCAGTVPSQGVLQVDLIDNNNLIINDQGGVANSFTTSLSSLTQSYTPYSGVFRTPEIMPSSYSIRLHLTTPLPNTVSVYLDKASLGVMSQLYTGGPYVSVHSGSVPFIQSPVGDFGSILVTNSRGAGGTLSTWQTLLFQLFNNLAQSNEILWPSSSTPTISDSLIN